MPSEGTIGYDWWTSGGGTKYTYSNGVSVGAYATDRWNSMAASITTYSTVTAGYGSAVPFAVLGTDWLEYNRGLNGYMSELICHNTPKSVSDATAYYANRLF